MKDLVMKGIRKSYDGRKVLDDLSVARNHCVIDEAEGKYYLNDLGSGTGTYVDGKRTDQALLERGMHISIGASELIVER